MDSDYLFVYGTLQKESDNDMSKFLSNHSRIIGKGYILGKLYKISWFPGTVLSNDTSEMVHGTVFKLRGGYDNILDVIDDYEGFHADNLLESLFVRTQTTVFLENSNDLTAWTYIYNQKVEEQTRINSGDFLKDVAQ